MLKSNTLPQSRNNSGIFFECLQGEENITFSGQGDHTTFGAKFLAGILHNLPALMSFTSPSPNSFTRVAPSTWSGAYKCWGVNNREAPLRVLHLPEVADSTNVELKAFDATANPHVGLAAAMLAGVMGVSKELILPEQIDVDPGEGKHLVGDHFIVSC